MNLVYGEAYLPVHHPEDACRICGCTDDTPCEGGCWWDEDHNEICSHCMEWIEAIILPGSPNEVGRALGLEDNANVLAVALDNARGDWRRVAIRKRQGELAGGKPAREREREREREEAAR